MSKLIESQTCPHCKFTVRIDKGPLLIYGNGKYSSQCLSCNNWFVFHTQPGDMLSSYIPGEVTND